MGNDHINPFDGYRCQVHDNLLEGENQLLLELRASGEHVFPPVTIFRRKGDSGSAECGRMAYVIRAVCRYTNAGGDMSQFLDVLAKAYDVLKLYRLPIDPDWLFFEMHDNANEFQTLFVNTDTSAFIVVSEDTYCETVEAADLLRDFNEADSIEEMVYAGAAELTRSAELLVGENREAEGQDSTGR